jgi:hypothetical protein
MSEPTERARRVRRYQADPEKAKAATLRWRQANPERVAETNRVHNFRKVGVEYERGTYARKLAEQEGRCAICGHVPGEGERSLRLDHCHTTLKLRDLLCDGCNTGLGLFRDDPLRLLAAVEYLLRHEPKDWPAVEQWLLKPQRRREAGGR